MSPLSKAALIIAALALAGCKDFNEGLNLLEGKPTDAVPAALAAFDPPPDYGPGSAQIAAIIETTPDPVPRYVVLEGNGPMGEELAQGPDCHNAFRSRICMDQPSPYPWWPTNADLQP